MAEPVHIWCDGSYRLQHNTLGAAWVQAAADGDVNPLQQSIRLPKLHNSHAHGSDVAEIMAFTHAMNALETPDNVIVHMDCRNVIEWLSGGAITNASKKREAAVAKAFEAAMAAKARAKTIIITYTSDKNSPNMGLAHQLSRAASTPQAEDRTKPNAHKNTKHPSRPRHTRG